MQLAILSSPNHIHYEESNLNFLYNAPRHFDCGIQLICINGEALISTGAQQFHLKKMSELIFWRGTILQLINSSTEFRVRMILYPSQIFLQAAITLDSTFFNYMREFPYKDHSQTPYNWRHVNLWMDMAQMLFTQPPSKFTPLLEQNYLQSLFMWIFSAIPKIYVQDTHTFTRKQIIFHRFMYLIHEHAATEHQLTFYTQQLCISSRYLSEICVIHSNGKTPKKLIDEQLTAEIKVLLNRPDLSIAEIAMHCHFPDASYLSRFFKKNTNITPKEYRDKSKLLITE